MSWDDTQTISSEIEYSDWNDMVTYIKSNAQKSGDTFTGNVEIQANLTLDNGASINEFSTDGTLAGNSDTAVPTEKAIKTYVDNNSSGGAGVVKVERTMTGVLTTGDNPLLPIVIDDELDGLDLKEVRLSLNGLPTGQSVKVDVRKNGSASADSLFTSDVPIECGTGQSATNGVYMVGCDSSAATVGTPGTTLDGARDTMSSDDVLWIYIVQTGSTLPGVDLVVSLTFG